MSSFGSRTQESMAYVLNKIASHFQSQSQVDLSSLLHRRFHVEPGTREKALLAEAPCLSRFRSNKAGVSLIKKVGDVLTIVVVAGCCYELYVKATMREEARQGKRASSEELNALLAGDNYSVWQ